MDAMGVVEQAFGSLGGMRLLDIGCGDGSFVRTLAARGVVAAGVDPAVAGSEGPLYPAGAEALPFADGSFDGAVFVNSLHHVPVALMARGLREAARVVGSGGRVVVIEPLASGSFFAALRVIEDETQVRAAAQAAVVQAIEDGVFSLVAQVDFVRRDVFDGIAPFLARVVAALPSRAGMIARERPVIEAAFEEASVRDAHGGWVLEQPVRAQILQVV